MNLLLSLKAVLADFEDACDHLDSKHIKLQINLVADSLRLGGAILGRYHYPQMKLIKSMFAMAWYYFTLPFLDFT